MTSKTLVRKSTPDAKFATVVSEELPLDQTYFEDAFQRLLGKEEFRTASERTEIDRPRPDVAFIQGLAVPEGPEGVTFNGTQELSSNARNYFLPRPRYGPSFGSIPAFGMWADRTESDEDLLRELGSQWDSGGEAD